MVADAAVDTVLPFVLAVGVPLLVALFYFEGVIVGKLLQPTAVFVAYIAIVRPMGVVLVAITVVCTLAATVGQWTLYRGFDDDAPEFFGLRRRVPALARFPEQIEKRVGKRRLRVVDRAFERYGGVGIVICNLVPGIRGLSAIPAGLSDYPRSRFLVASTVGNVAHLALLVAVAFGVLELATLIR